MEKLVQVRRADKRTIGYQMIFKSGKVIFWGKQKGKSYCEVNLDRPVGFIESSGPMLDQAGKTYIKLIYLDKHEKFIDSCALYTNSYSASWEGRRCKIDDGLWLCGFDVICESDQTISALNYCSWVPNKKII